MPRFTHSGVLAEFDKRVRERIATETEAIANGRAKDWTDYKVRVERRKTLLLALEELDKSVKTYLEEDDREDAN